jgi:hypothetical protein
MMSVIPRSYPGVVGGTRGALGVHLCLQRCGFGLSMLDAQPFQRRFLLRDLPREPVGGRAATACVRPRRVTLATKARPLRARGAAPIGRR